MATLLDLSIQSLGEMLRKRSDILDLSRLQLLPAELRERIISESPLHKDQLRACLCANIICIEAPWCSYLTSKKLGDIGKICPNLRSLTVATLPFCGAQKALRRLSNLTTLSIPHSFLEEFDLIEITESCPKLQNLNVAGCDNVTDHFVQTALTKLPFLASLNLTGCKYITDSAFNVNPLSTSLSCLHLKGCDLTDKTLVSLADMGYSNLEELEATGTRTASNGVFSLIEKCTKLKNLKIGESEASVDALTYISSLKTSLTCLSLSWCTNACDTNVAIIAETCQNLQSIRLRACAKITDESLISFGKSITSVNLSGCEAITDTGMYFLIRNCVNMRSMNISWCIKVSMSCIIESVHRWKNLIKLNLEGCKMIKDELLYEIGAEKPNFQYLRLAWVNDASDLAIAALVQRCDYIKVWNYYGDCSFGRFRKRDEDD